MIFVGINMSTEHGEGRKPNWTGLINESVHTSDDKDIGDIEAVNRDFVVVKRGFRKGALLLYSSRSDRRMG